ncbi:uncharacterized protein LOC133730476 [Rosa rugosa]|uniref:uncharacterized protein LOC133730476 n=1 Tax=Rosa rugosa TaxID=74645 RepID=UPI002B40FFB9|nr:uncharacterized protein LOC133730476 [Rosa rugosa]
MTARLATRLSLKDGEEPVDLGNLRCPDKGFLANQFFLVGSLNSAQAVVLDSFRSAVRSMWRLSIPVEEKRDITICALQEGYVEQVKVSGIRRQREEEAVEDRKRAKHALALVPSSLQPENMGFTVTSESLFEVTVTSEVDKNGYVIERFIGIEHVANTTAITLKEAIDALLCKHSLSISSLRGQGFDGASNMSGELNGLKTLILKENSSAFYVHCFAHQLQRDILREKQSLKVVQALKVGELSS